jgi:hypothetical protein
MVRIFLGPPEMWKYCPKRNQAMLREVELKLYFTQWVQWSVPVELILKILGLEQ